MNIENKPLYDFHIQYAKPSIFELRYNFFHKCCDENHFEELERDIESLYLPLAEENLDDCMIPEKKTMLRGNNIVKLTVETTLKPIQKKFRRCAEIVCLCLKEARRIASLIVKLTKSKLVSKNLTKNMEDSEVRAMSKYSRVLDKAANLNSTNGGFKASKYLFRLHEQTNKGPNCFYSNRKIPDDKIHSKLLNL